MRLSVTDVIRRGFENTIANWPLLVIRIAEGMVMFVIVLIAIFAAIVPVAMSLGLGAIDTENPADAAEHVLDVLINQWMIIVYVLALATVVLIVLLAIHSFVEAGSAAVYIEGERAAGRAPNSGRAQMKVFSGDRWWSGARRDWWPVFWIYNIAWAVAGLIILVPFLATLLLMLAVRDHAGAVVGIGCIGLAIGFLIFIVTAIVTNLWCEKAIVVCVDRLHRATGALGEAWREFRADAGRHIGVAAILFLLMIVGSGVFASISFVGGWSDSATFALAMLPLQLIGSIANSILSAIIQSWFVACFAALTVDRTA